MIHESNFAGQGERWSIEVQRPSGIWIYHSGISCNLADTQAAFDALVAPESNVVTVLQEREV
jgi:hypothetical protein